MDHPDDYVEAARKEFKAFYSTATPIDATRMDRLIHLHRVLADWYKKNADNYGPSNERRTNSAEREFIKTRFDASSCPTFMALAPGDRARIEAVLFNPFGLME